MAKLMNLTCPVEDAEGNPCEQDIKVWAEPWHPATSAEPGSPGYLDDIEEAPCGHAEVLLSGSYDDALWRQVEAQAERDYEDWQEARAEHERDRWYGDA